MRKKDDITDIKYEGGVFTGKYTRYFDGENACDQAYVKNADLIMMRIAVLITGSAIVLSFFF